MKSPTSVNKKIALELRQLNKEMRAHTKRSDELTKKAKSKTISAEEFAELNKMNDGEKSTTFAKRTLKLMDSTLKTNKNEL